ncbi:transposase [bacterium]|nr:transposase [bacterium]
MNSQYFNRKSHRKEDYDYSGPGWYFVTVCTFQSRSIFGDIENGTMILNSFGRILEKEWYASTKLRKNLTTDAFVIMPNHFHGIIVINEDESGQSLSSNSDRKNITLGTIVGEIKARTTKRIRETSEDSNLQVWQRSFYDIIIRNERSINLMRLYIQSNPIMWTVDHENPEFEPTKKLISEEYINKGIFTKKDLETIRNYIIFRRWRTEDRNRIRGQASARPYITEKTK